MKYGKKIIPAFVYTFFLFLPVFSQPAGFSQEIDSLSALLDTVQSDKKKAEARFALAKVYRRKGNHEKAKKILKDNIKHCQSFEDNTFLMKNYGVFAHILRVEGNYSESLKYFLKVDSLANLSGVSKRIVVSKINLGILYMTMKDYNKALYYYESVFALVADDPKVKSALHVNVSAVFIKLKQYDSVAYHAKAAIALKEKHGMTKGLAHAYNNLGGAYKERRNYTQALYWFGKSSDHYTRMRDKSGIIKSYNNLGNTYLALKKYAEAAKYLHLADSLLGETSYNQYEKNYTTLYLYKLYKAQRQWEKALSYFEKHKEMNEDILETEKIKVVKELQTKYETEQHLKNKELAEEKTKVARKEVTQSRQVSVLFSLLFLVTIVSAVFVYSRLRIIRTQKKALDRAYGKLEESKKNELAISHLKALQSQMNPHFIFNALNSVQDLVLLEDIRSSNKYLGKFSDLIRKILLSSKKQFISLKEEVEILMLYLDLEKLRFGAELDISFRCEISDGRQDSIYLPAMFIQPYVENAIKHGLLHKTENKKLYLFFSEEKSFLKCVIEDNGIGRKKAQNLKIRQKHLHAAFATQATQERVRLFNQTSDDKIKVSIIDLEDGQTAKGTRVVLQFPLKI